MCKAETEFDRSGRLVTELLAADVEDIVDYGQFPGNDKSLFEIVLRTEDWPERGLSIVVHLRSKKCVSYGLSTAIRVETREH